MSFSKKNKTIFILLMVLIPLFIVGVVFGFIENHLTQEVYFPGSFVKYFEVVDTLILSDEVFADSNGIQKLNREYYQHHEDYKAQGYVINSDGFRSREFIDKKNRNSDEPVVLFLGDSHTFGASADPITECFADLINNSGYIVYNTGIPGADPAQYWAVAKTYVHRLKPDICILMFDASNDRMWFRRDPRPYVPMDYWTNAGIIHAWKSAYIPDSRNQPFASAQEAYQFYVDHYTLKKKEANFLQRICARSNTLTQAYRILSGWQDPQRSVEVPATPHADYYLDKIDSLCQAEQVKFQIILVPSMSNLIEDPQEFKQANPGLFVHHKIMIPKGIEREDYVANEFHFNNAGHRKMADFILSYLDTIIKHN